MLVVMQEGATEAQVEAVINRLTEEGFDVHRSTGVMHTVLGGVGGKTDFDTVSFAVMEGVKEAHPIVSPYKLASAQLQSCGHCYQDQGRADRGRGSGRHGWPVQRGGQGPDRDLR